MTKKEYILDDGRKVRYWLYEWTNNKTDTTYYAAEVSIYEKRRRLLTLGLTEKWKRIDGERDERIPHSEGIAKKRMKELRSIVFGEYQHPLDKLLDDILADIEPKHNQ